MPRRVLHDRYFRQAKAEGYRARSAYKLAEIQEKRAILRPGHRVLDLGCAPGSWLQVASQVVGPRGVVVGVDLQEVEPGLPANVRVFRGDVTAVAADTLTAAAGGLFDAVLSDMAPNTTGAGDHFRSERLCRAVLDLLPRLLRPGGALVMKVFEGEKYPALLRDTTRLFAQAKGFKPHASRDISSEIYILATGYRPPHPPAPGGGVVTSAASDRGGTPPDSKKARRAEVTSTASDREGTPPASNEARRAEVTSTASDRGRTPAPPAPAARPPPPPGGGAA